MRVLVKCSGSCPSVHPPSIGSPCSQGISPCTILGHLLPTAEAVAMSTGHYSLYHLRSLSANSNGSCRVHRALPPVPSRSLSANCNNIQHLLRCWPDWPRTKVVAGQCNPTSPGIWVVASPKSGRCDLVKSASSKVNSVKPNFLTVLNKIRTYDPLLAILLT